MHGRLRRGSGGFHRGRLVHGIRAGRAGGRGSVFHLHPSPPNREKREGGNDPLIGLATTLLRPEALPELARVAKLAQDDAAGLAAKLSARPDAAASLVGEALDHAAMAFERTKGLKSTPRARLALVVDQLEEFFTHDLHPLRRQAFITLLAVLARSGRAWVLATL